MKKRELILIDRKGIIQFIKFGMVGLSNTVISYVVYMLMIWLGMHYLVASVVGFIISVINSFFWNNRFVFKTEDGEKRNPWKTLVKTFISYAGTGLLLSNILLIVWVELFELPEWLGPILNLAITVPLNFLLNKLWAFKNEKRGQKVFP